VADAINLDLEIETVGMGAKQREVARIYLASAVTYTRGEAAPTLTANCPSYTSFEREIERLREELSDALETARVHFDGPNASARDRQGTPREASGPEQVAASAKAHIDATLTVADAMTRDVKTVHRNDSLARADELMKRGAFRHVVVLDEENTVVGVISHRDIFFGALAWSMGQGKGGHERALEAYVIKEVMRPTVQTVESTTQLSEAAAAMIAGKIGCLPVVEGGRLVGILTEGDFLALLAVA